MMNIDEKRRQIWGKLEDKPASPMSTHMKQFTECAEALYKDASDEAYRPAPYGLIIVNQKMLLLQRKYFEYKNKAPKKERGQIANVFEAYYYKLYELEQRLNPPILYVAPERPKEKSQVEGLILGEEE
jgi:hypothetical protein